MGNWYYENSALNADGYFGDATLAAVKTLQKDLGLEADGIVGPKTIKAMQEAKK